MHSLREIQAGFAAALFDPSASRQAPGIRSHGISPSQRLGFYRTNVFENYRKALSVTYSVVEQLIGSGLFSALAQDYASRYHSRSGDVGEQGAHFAAFIAKHPVARELPYLADVARLEWCLEECFNERDPQLLSLDRLSAVPQELCGELRFLLAPSCRLVSSRYPIDRIWEMCQPGFPSEERIDLNAGGVDLIVRREGFSVVTERLTRAELAMSTALSSGYAFSEAFDYARSIEPDFDAGAFLRRYLANGVLADFTLPAEAGFRSAAAEITK
jgi:hypothetical protein